MRPAPLTLPPRWASTGTSARQTHEVIFRAGKRRDLVWSSGRTCASTWHATSSSAAVSSSVGEFLISRGWVRVDWERSWRWRRRRS